MTGLAYESVPQDLVTCNFCGRVLGREYYFACHVCGATLCYIHTSRHARAHDYQHQERRSPTLGSVAAES